MRTLFVVLLLVFSAVAIPVEAVTASTPPECLDGLIVFQRGHNVIYGKCPTTGTESILADTAAKETRPTLSPDGTRLAYGAGDTGSWRIRIKNLTTGEDVALSTRNGELPDEWSPDGSKIAFSSSADAYYNWDLWVWDLETGAKTQITTSGASGRSTGLGRWSPDGEWLYYNVEHSPNKLDIYRAPSDGGPATRLTNFSSIALSATNPRPSPDGLTVAFVVHGAGLAQLWLYDIGTGLSFPTRVVAPFLTGCCPAGLDWSPDGTKLVFGGSDATIWLVDILTQVALPFTQGESMDWGPGSAPRLGLLCGLMNIPIWCREPISFNIGASTLSPANLTCAVEALGSGCVGVIAVDGLFTINVSADISGGFAREFRLALDATAPVASTECAGRGGWCRAVKGVVSDATSGLASASCRVDASLVNCGILSLTDGLYDVAVAAEDVAGNTATTTTQVRVDATPPSTVASCIGRGGWCRSVAGDASDNLSGIAATSCAVDGRSVACGALSLSDGFYVVSIAAEDVAGNVGATIRDIQVDATPPEVALIGCAPLAEWCGPGAVVASDATSGVEIVTCHRANVLVPCEEAESIDGMYRVLASDRAGHVTERTFQVDATPPSGFVWAPHPTSLTGRIIVYATDTGSGTGAWAVVDRLSHDSIGPLASGTFTRERIVCTGDGQGAGSVSTVCQFRGLPGVHCYDLVVADRVGNRFVTPAHLSLDEPTSPETRAVNSCHAGVRG